MLQTIQEFIDMLRKSGIRVSVSESIDCLKGLNHIEFLNKDEFSSLLKSTLIKRKQDHPEFDRLFRLYFEKHQYSIQDDSPDQISREALKALENANGMFSELFRTFMQEGAQGVIPYFFQQRGSGSVPGMGSGMASFSTMRSKHRIKEDDWPAQVSSLVSLLRQKGVPSLELDDFQERIENRMEHLMTLINDYIEHEKTVFKKWKEKTAGEDLLKKDFWTLTENDHEAISEAIQKLVSRIKDEYALRQRRQKSGKIDIKKTLRSSLQYGGLPLEISWKRKKKSKGKIVVLCDVSNSVRNATQFMLTLLYSLQDQFSKVRSFLFVSELGEVTKFFEEYEIKAAVDEALNNADISYYSSTSYSSVLKQFYDEYFDIVNSRTTVIIIGDARNNYAIDPNDLILEKMKQKARRIIWLNPERQVLWGSGDSVIYTYKKFCNEVRECWNVGQLMEFIDDLVL